MSSAIVSSSGGTPPAARRAGWRAPAWLGGLLLTAPMLLSTSAESPAADQNCTPPHFHFANEGVTPAEMSVRRGTGCKFHFEMTNSTFGLAGILSSVVTLRPKNGLLGKNTMRIYVYKPNDDYAGDDEFEIKVGYNRDDGNGEHTTLLHVKVTVY